MFWDVMVVSKFMQNSWEHEGGGESVLEEGFCLNKGCMRVGEGRNGMEQTEREQKESGCVRETGLLI